MKFFAPMISLCLLLMPMAQGRSDNFLDLTKLKPPKDEKLTARGGGGVSGSHDTPFPKLPLEITLLNLDNGSYKMGQEMIYEVTIRNVGQDIVLIPWSPDPTEVRRNGQTYPSGYADGNVGLVIHDEIAGDQVVYGPWLYGSDLVPSSLKKLRPGQTVRIRAPGRWAIADSNGSQRILSRLPQKYVVRARFSLSNHTFAPQPEPIMSANSVTVELKRRNE